MNGGDKHYLWQRDDRPRWRYNHQRLAPLLAQVHQAQGHLLGRMHDMGMDLRDQATLRVLTEDVLKTSEIEGETLNPDSVRSSIARRLGSISVPWPRSIDTLTAWWTWCSMPPRSTTRLSQQSDCLLARGLVSHRLQRTRQNPGWSLARRRTRADASGFRALASAEGSL